MTLHKIVTFWNGLRRIFPLTRAGASLAVIDGFALWAEGLRHQDFVILAAAAVILASQVGLTVMVVACAAVARFFPRCTEASQILDLETSEGCGDSQATDFAVSFPAWIPFVTLSWDWRQPSGVVVTTKRERGQLREHIVAPYRFASNVIDRQFRCADFLGLAEVSWIVQERRSVRILPARAETAAFALRAGVGQGSEQEAPSGDPLGSLTEMREYRPGDSPRLIRWKLFAHSRKLVVRTPEPALEESPNACAWLAGGASSEAAARLAREALESGILGEQWGFGASGSPTIVLGDLDAARDRIAGSGGAREMDTREILSFLANAERAGFSACYMFLSAETARFAAEMKQISGQSPIALHAIFAVSAVAPSLPPQGLVQQLLWKPAKRSDRATVAANVNVLASFFQSSEIYNLAAGTFI